MVFGWVSLMCLLLGCVYVRSSPGERGEAVVRKGKHQPQVLPDKLPLRRILGQVHGWTVICLAFCLRLLLHTLSIEIED